MKSIRLTFQTRVGKRYQVILSGKVPVLKETLIVLFNATFFFTFVIIFDLEVTWVSSEMSGNRLIYIIRALSFMTLYFGKEYRKQSWPIQNRARHVCIPWHKWIFEALPYGIFVPPTTVTGLYKQVPLKNLSTKAVRFGHNYPYVARATYDGPVLPQIDRLLFSLHAFLSWKLLFIQKFK